MRFFTISFQLFDHYHSSYFYNTITPVGFEPTWLPWEGSILAGASTHPLDEGVLMRARSPFYSNRYLIGFARPLFVSNTQILMSDLNRLSLPTKPWDYVPYRIRTECFQIESLAFFDFTLLISRVFVISQFITIASGDHNGLSYLGEVMFSRKVPLN